MKRPDNSMAGRKPHHYVSTLTPIDVRYRSAFERLWNSKSSEIVPASKPAHAATVLALFLEKAKERVLIFSDFLDQKVFGEEEVLDGVKQAVARGIRVQVIVKNPGDGSCAFTRLIEGKLNADGSKVYLNRAVHPDVIRSIEGNFAVVDDRGYIFQEVACPHDMDAAETLADLFSTIRRHL